jgi:hypothetical protein
MGARKSWFIVQGDARRGPFSSSELKQFASEGKIERSTQVWKEGLKQPVLASRIKGLFSAAPDRASDVLPEQHVSGNSDLASSENLLPQLSRAKLRDLVSSQKREIAEIALSKSASQPGFLELKQRYITLAKEAEDLKSAIPAITTAGEQLKVAEQNVKAARKSVEAATKELLSQAEPLGEFGFECWDVLSDSAKIYLQPRQDLKSRIQNLMQKLADSNATSNVTIMEKAKVKATQLKLNAQLQVEKLKIKSANRQAGLALLEANDEVLVQSDQTQNILEIVSNRRRAIDELKQESAELAGPLEKATRAAGQAVGQPIKGLNDFTQIVKGHQKLIKTKDGELHSIRDDVADLLVSDSSLARTLGLADKVTQLTDTTQRLDDSPHAVSVATKAGRNWFGGLSDFGKIASVAGLLIGLCLVGWWIMPGGSRSITDVDPDVIAGQSVEEKTVEEMTSAEMDREFARMNGEVAEMVSKAEDTTEKIINKLEELASPEFYGDPMEILETRENDSTIFVTKKIQISNAPLFLTIGFVVVDKRNPRSSGFTDGLVSMVILDVPMSLREQFDFKSKLTIESNGQKTILEPTKVVDLGGGNRSIEYSDLYAKLLHKQIRNSQTFTILHGGKEFHLHETASKHLKELANQAEYQIIDEGY